MWTITGGKGHYIKTRHRQPLIFWENGQPSANINTADTVQGTKPKPIKSFEHFE